MNEKQFSKLVPGMVRHPHEPRAGNGMLAVILCGVITFALIFGVSVLKDQRKHHRGVPTRVLLDHCYIWNDGHTQCPDQPWGA